MFRLPVVDWPRAARRLWWATAAGLLGVYLAAWPLVWRAVLEPAADPGDHSFWTETYGNPHLRGQLAHAERAFTSQFQLDGPQSSLISYALWRAPRAGVYQFQMRTEDVARVYVDRGELCRDGAVVLEEGPHFLAATLEGRGHSGRLDLSVSAPGEGTPQLLRGESLAALPCRCLRLWRLTKVVEWAALIGLALTLLARPLLFGPSYSACLGVLRRRPAQLVTVALFFVFLLLPALQSRYNLFPIPPLDENRVRVPPPALTWKQLARSDDALATGFEKYFNDRYGLRDLFVRAKHQLDFSLLGRADEVVIGKQGWLEYRNVIDRQEVNQERVLSHFDRLCADTRFLAEYLRGRGVQLVVVSCPMKNTIYPEYFRSGTPRRPADTPFQRYRRFLNTCPELIHIDAQEMLERTKPDMPVFHQTDFHWNDPAGFLIARRMVEAIAAREGVDGGVWRHPLEIDRQDFRGGLTQSLALLYPPREQMLFVRRNWTDQGSFNYAPPRPFEWVFRAADDGAARLPSALMYGNSFADAFTRSGVYNTFRELRRVRRGRSAGRRCSTPSRTIAATSSSNSLKSMCPTGCWTAFRATARIQGKRANPLDAAPRPQGEIGIGLYAWRVRSRKPATAGDAAEQLARTPGSPGR